MKRMHSIKEILMVFKLVLWFPFSLLCLNVLYMASLCYEWGIAEALLSLSFGVNSIAT